MAATNSRTIYCRSQGGDGAGLAARLAIDGHRVVVAPTDLSALPLLKGIVAGAVAHPSPTRRDLVLVDDVGHAPEAKRWRNQGVAVIGGNEVEKWETDRMVGAEVMRVLGGLDMTETKEFHSVRSAVQFLEKTGGEWYFKPDGDVPKSFTRRGDTDWLVRFLRWAAPQLTKVPRFILQAPCPKGTEIDVAVWLNPLGVVGYEACVEEKKYMTGDRGPATGCASNVVWSIPECPLTIRTIAPFVPALLDSGYTGIASVNVILTEKETFGLEFTMRLGWDSTQASLVRFDDSLPDQLHDFAEGTLERWHHPKTGGMTLRLSLPPQPQEESKDHRMHAGMPLPDDLLDHDNLWPEDVALTDEGPVTALGTGSIGVVATSGTSPDRMRKTLLESAKGLEIPDLGFREDPVSRLETVFDFLRAHKLCPDPFDP